MNRLPLLTDLEFLYQLLETLDHSSRLVRRVKPFTYEDAAKLLQSGPYRSWHGSATSGSVGEILARHSCTSPVEMAELRIAVRHAEEPVTGSLVRLHSDVT